MFNYVREGFRATLRQPFPVLVLFLYRFGWGIALYKICQSVILPLLHRYPNSDGLQDQARLFMAEGQFVLLKTDISRSYLLLLVILLAVRMLMTPLLNAGLLFSLANPHYNAGYRFVRGMRELGKSCGLLYVLQLAMTAAPLWWLLPKLREAVQTSASYPALGKAILLPVAAMLAYGFLLQLLFLYVQFGRAQSATVLRSLAVALRSLPLVLGVAALLLLAAAVCSLAVLGASMLWAGFWALVIYQAYRFVQTVFSVWGIAAQHQLFTAKTRLK